MAQFFDTYVNAHIFRSDTRKAFVSHLHKAGFLMIRDICKPVNKSQRIWKCISIQKPVYEYVNFLWNQV